MSIFLMLLVSEPGIHSEIYGYLSPRMVAHDGLGQVYVMDDHSFVIRQYSPIGEELVSFGGAGQGPGEFNYATHIWVDGNVFVFDAEEQAVTELSPNGSFVRLVHAPVRGIVIRRSPGSWVFGNWVSAMNSEPGAKVNVFHTRGSLDEAKSIFETKGNGYGATFIAEGKESIYTPVHWVPHLVARPDHEFVYLVDQEKLKVTVFDASGKQVNQWHQAMPIIEFNPDWANIRLKEVKAMFPERSYQTNYYQTFPVVRSVILTPLDRLVFRLWTHEPHLTEKLVVFSGDGTTDTSRNWAWQDWLRVHGKIGDKILVSAQEKEEEQVLRWIQSKDLSDFIVATSQVKPKQHGPSY